MSWQYRHRKKSSLKIEIKNHIYGILIFITQDDVGIVSGLYA
jgi:hypothetical protein